VDDQLSRTLEDYLQAIYRIEAEKRVARPRDICKAQGVAASTVTAALQSLGDKGLINYEPYELITLTAEGREKAEQLATRHHIVRNFLEDILGLQASEAEATACEMEHAVGPHALERFVCFLAFVGRHSPAGVDWLDEFRRFMQEGADGHSCEECVKEYRKTLQTQNRD